MVSDVIFCTKVFLKVSTYKYVKLHGEYGSTVHTCTVVLTTLTMPHEGCRNKFCVARKLASWPAPVGKIRSVGLFTIWVEGGAMYVVLPRRLKMNVWL